MNDKLYFYKCEDCNQMVVSCKEIKDSLSCCNKPMCLLTPCTGDGISEKHVPVYTVEGQYVTVSIGSLPHPMTAEHYIEWICLVTDQGIQWRPLSPDVPPTVCFKIRCNEKVKNVYEYCNIHGLWACPEKQ